MQGIERGHGVGPFRLGGVCDHAPDHLRLGNLPLGGERTDAVGRCLIQGEGSAMCHASHTIYHTISLYALQRRPHGVATPGCRPDDRRTAAGLSGSRACTGLVWVVDPERELVRVYRADESESIVQAGGTVSAESAVPGFVLALLGLFD